MSTIPTNRDSDRFMLRLPDGMRDRIKAAAEANNRSMNAEIVATLEDAYPQIDDTSDESLFLEYLTRSDRIDREMTTCLDGIESAKTSEEVQQLGERFRALVALQRQVRTLMQQSVGVMKPKG